MAYTLGNKCAKNLCKRTVLVCSTYHRKCGHMFFETQCIHAFKHQKRLAPHPVYSRPLVWSRVGCL